MKKYNKSVIMSRAHTIRKTTNVSMSAALVKAWAEAKAPKFVDSKAVFMAAFTAKYPTGTIEIHQFWNGAQVQFTANGKVYFYRGQGWQDRLIAA